MENIKDLDDQLSKIQYEFLNSNYVQSNKNKLVEAIKTIKDFTRAMPQQEVKGRGSDLRDREKEILTLIINKAIKSGDFLKYLSEDELNSKYNVLNSIIDKLSNDYNLELENNLDVIKININRDDLQEIKSGINKLISLVEEKIGSRHDANNEWLNSLYKLINNKFNFDNIKDCDFDSLFKSNDEGVEFDDDSDDCDFDD